MFMDIGRLTRLGGMGLWMNGSWELASLDGDAAYYFKVGYDLCLEKPSIKNKEIQDSIIDKQLYPCG